MKKFANILCALSLCFAVACSPMGDEDVMDEDDIELIDEEGGEEEEEQQEEEEEEEEEEVEEVRVAEFDNDSLQNPAQSVFMSITGTRTIIHTDDVSFPEGDEADFIEFELPNNSNPNQTIWVTLDAAFEGQQDALLRATLFEDGVQSTRSVLANDGEVTLTVDNTKVQTLRISFTSVAEATYADYTLTVKGFR